MRTVVYGLLVLLYALHTDIWYWNDGRIVLGLPIGVTYHVVWMIAVSVVYWMAVRYAWPTQLDDGLETSPPTGDDRHQRDAAELASAP